MPAPSKRDKQNAKRGTQNRSVRSNLRNLSKNFYRAMDEGDTEQAQELRDRSQIAFSKAAGKGNVHPNKASRKISRFDKALASANNQA